MKLFKTVMVVFLITLVGCKEEKTAVKSESESTEIKEVKEKEVTQKEQFVNQSVDDQLAKKIKSFLINDYLKDDIKLLNDTDRTFQLYKIDLNKDGKNETFVRFMTPYFCGTGGCSFLLLDQEMRIITNFSVTRAPIFAEQTYKNGWQILLVKDAGVFKELVYHNGSYPSNPSLLEKAPYDAPSGHAEIMFDKDFSNCKTYNF